MSINLNDDQNIILNKLQDFINGESGKFYLLTGLAGTGKTFLVTYLLTLSELMKKKIAVTGCTNKAVGVLENSFNKNMNIIKKDDFNESRNITFLTIHKLLQVKRKIDSKGEEIFESNIDENNIKVKSKSIFYYDIIIVDEVSMLNRDMVIQILKLQPKIKGKIIFLGDKAQLPPVREPESHIFELADKKIPHSFLSKIMRSGDQIINFVNSIRKLIDEPDHKVPFKKLATSLNKDESRITLFRNEDEWIQKYITVNKSDIDQIILCYTNRRVDYLNQRIRKILFKTDSNNFVNGEKIIFNNTYHLPTNQNKYDSSQMVIINSVSIDEIKIRPFNLYDIITIRFPLSSLLSGSVFLKKKYNISEKALMAGYIEKDDEYLKNFSDTVCQICYYVDIDSSMNFNGKCGHHYCNMCFYSWDLNLKTSSCPLCLLLIKDGNIIADDNHMITKLFEELRNITKNQHIKYKIWLIMLENKDLLYVIHPDDKEKYTSDIDKIKNKLRDMNNYILTHKKDQYKFWEKIMLQLWEFYYYFYIDQFAQINYGNVITTHRSQGSTYKRVYVDLIDIIKSNDNKKEGFQCLYTAVTRASENLEILF